MKQTAVFKTYAAAVLAALSVSVHAHDMHAHGDMAMDSLPDICQSYFKRAEACFGKAEGKAAQFHKDNTEILFHSLFSATKPQRLEMCNIADKEFSAKAQTLKCE